MPAPGTHSDGTNFVQRGDNRIMVSYVLRDGVPMRYFPIAAKGDVHVPLRVVEDIDGGSLIELRLLADTGVSGSVVIDMGMVEH